MSFLQRMIANSRIRMMAAGALSVLIAYLAFLFCLYLGIHYLLASIANFFVYLLINFVLNRTWAFKSDGEVKKQAIAHLSLHLGNQLLIMIGLYLLVELLGLLPAWAQIIMQIITAITAFIITPIIFRSR